MKWNHPVIVAVVAGLSLIAHPAMASEPVDEARQAVDTYIDHADPELTAAALLATAHIGSSDQHEQLEIHKTATGHEERLAAAAGLVLSGDDEGASFAAEQLLEAIDIDDALLRLSAYLSDPQLRDVIEVALPEAEGRDRRAIVYFMANQQGPVYDALIQRVTGADDDLRQLAMEAVSYTAGEQTVEVIEGLSNHRDAAIRAQTLDLTEALKHRRDLRSQIVETLEGALDDSEADIRRRAARQLVELGEARGAQVLTGLLAEAESEERVEILELLLDHDATADVDEIRPLIEEVEFDEEGDRQRERELLYEFAATDVDNQLLADLSAKMSSTTFDDRLVALGALGRTGLPEARQMLSDSLGEGRSDVRRLSARGLGQIGHPDSLDDLRAQLTGERDDEVRLVIIEAIGQIRDAKSVHILRFLRSDRSTEVRLALVDALETIGLPESIRDLENILEQRDTEVQWRAFVALLSLDVDTARGSASMILRNPPDRFGHDLDPDKMNDEAREMVYEAILTHRLSRIRSVGVEHVKANRDALMPIARQVVVDPDLDANTRAELVHLIATAADDDDRQLFERVVRNFSEEPAGRLAAWELIGDLDEDSEEVFAQLADAEEGTPMAIIARVALAKME